MTDLDRIVSKEPEYALLKQKEELNADHQSISREGTQEGFA